MNPENLNEIHVKNGYIYFPKGTNIASTKKKKCLPNCPLSLECSGPFSQGGSEIAHVYDEKLSDAGIKVKGVCFKSE